MGIADEYLSAAIARARVVIAEVNDRVPNVRSRRRLQPEEIDVIVRTSAPLAEVMSRPPTDTEVAVAKRVAELIPNGATLQMGLGTLPMAVISELGAHADLGIHSGQIGDAVARLAEAGVITGSQKSTDRGFIVTGILMGSRPLFDFADDNPVVQLCSTDYTHDPVVLASQTRFAAIQTALEVDLSGQVNAETIGDEYIGGVGGAIDFLRGAHRSAGGLPIVALSSTAGSRSRIVAHLSGPVTAARSDAGIFVTEHGVADVRGLTLRQRRERLLAIADPSHREAIGKASASASHREWEC
jgi:acetyl-CoA hydrolase